MISTMCSHKPFCIHVYICTFFSELFGLRCTRTSFRRKKHVSKQLGYFIASDLKSTDQWWLHKLHANWNKELFLCLCWFREDSWLCAFGSNSMGLETSKSTWTSHSTCYGLIQQCKVKGQDSSRYFRWVLDRNGSLSRVSTESPAICGGNAGDNHSSKRWRIIGLVVCWWPSDNSWIRRGGCKEIWCMENRDEN